MKPYIKNFDSSNKINKVLVPQKLDSLDLILFL